MNFQKINFEKIKNVSNPLIYGKKPKLFQFEVEFTDNINTEKLTLNEKDYNTFLEKREVSRNNINFRVEQIIDNDLKMDFSEIIIDKKNVKMVLYPKNKLEDIINHIDEELKILHKKQLEEQINYENSNSNSDEKEKNNLSDNNNNSEEKITNHKNNVIDFINSFIKEISPLLENQIETKDNKIYYIESKQYDFENHNENEIRSKYLLTNSLGKIYKWFINDPYYTLFFRIFMSNFNFDTKIIDNSNAEYKVDGDWFIDYDFDSTPFAARKIISELKVYKEINIDLMDFFYKIFTLSNKLRLVDIMDSKDIIRL
jgi:hypothetical protein